MNDLRRLTTSGFTLVELMISLSIGSLMALTIAQSTEFAVKAIKTAAIQQDQSQFKSLIRSSILSSQTCRTLLSGTLVPSSTTTAVNLEISTTTNNVKSILHQYDTGLNRKLSEDLQISSITFTKNRDAYPAPPVGNESFVEGTERYWPILGTLNIDINNLALTGTPKRAFGQKVIKLAFPMAVTLKQPSGGGAWTVLDCSIRAKPAFGNNAGWVNSDIGSTHCATTTIFGNSPITCPTPGMYVAQQVQEDRTPQPIYSPTWANTFVYSDGTTAPGSTFIRTCRGSCKICSCIFKGASWENWNGYFDCSVNQQWPVQRDTWCGWGTCETIPSSQGPQCQRLADVLVNDITPTSTLRITCCRVRK